jgi:hypothetical protein
MEDEFLARYIIILINDHFILQRRMRRNPTVPYTDGLVTLLRDRTEQLTFITTYEQYYNATHQFETLLTIVLDAIDEQIESEFKRDSLK